MAWLTGWNNQKLLYINGSGNQTNYQMKITVNYGSGTDWTPPNNIYCNSQCKADFTDIRFTDSSGTLLYYWIESFSSSSNAIVWIKIPSIPTGDNSTYIYFYYGNISSPPLPYDNYNSGPDTFPLFDHFTGTTLDTGKWTVRGTGTVSVANSNATISAQNAASNDYKTIDSINTFGVGYSVHAYMKMVYDSTGSELYFGFGNTDQDYNGSTLFGSNYYWTTYEFISKSSGATTGISTGITEDSNYHIFKMNRASSSSTTVQVDNSGFTQITTTIPTTNLSTTIGARRLGDYAIVDWLFVRKYVSPEPSWSSRQPVTLNISSNPSGGEIWLATPTGSTWVDQHITTPSTIYVPSGFSYDVMVGVGGYQPWTLINVCTGNCAAGSIYNIVANPILLPGSLVIYSTPSGASIYLDGSGTSLGTTAPSGTTLTNISVGSHTIRLYLPSGYIDWTGSATVNTQAATTIRAVFAGSANTTSTPTNSSIYLDGNLTSIGNTPLIVTNLTPTTSDGTQPTQIHTYILKLTGYADTSGSFTATAGSTINVPVTFPGSLNITSIPIGAQIYIDNVLQ